MNGQIGEPKRRSGARIVHLTAGAGGFFCGTCIRDNALVRGLRALGHPAELVPLYLPILSEGEACAGDAPILMGGINVWLQANLPWTRALPRWLDAPLSARPLLRLAGSQAGRTRPEALGELTARMLQGVEGGLGKELDRLVDHLRGRADVLVLSNSLLAGLVRPLRDALGVPVWVTVQGEQHFVDAMGPPWRDRVWALLGEGLRAADGRVAVSAFAARAMAERTGVTDVRVVHNGVDLRGWGREAEPEAPTLGFLARLIPEKGVREIAEVWAELRARHPDLRLVVAGTVQAGGEADVARLRARVAEIGGRAVVRTNVSADEKRAIVHAMTVMSVPTQKDETFGTYNLEAMAAGVPVVAPDRGAVGEV
ncbi:MAG TPA: glycosyltransferase family 4 protein, partial [Myxococcota bacterium]|nr:glycosyltransferase family 4 protein [Myxococcota bacterium]